MRQPINTYDTLLRLIGHLLKILFVTMFSCTVLLALAGIFGAGEALLPIYQVLWTVFWKACTSLVGAILIVAMLDGLQ
ncbi:MAG: hypothetical protein ACFB12_07115 [Leptolyngbyaceae cyanobacterium]